MSNKLKEFYLLCRKGDINEVQNFLIQHPSVKTTANNLVQLDEDTPSLTPLSVACIYGHLEVVKFLLTIPSVDINRSVLLRGQYFYPIEIASRNGHFDIVLWILNQENIQCNFYINGYTNELEILTPACLPGRDDILMDLLCTKPIWELLNKEIFTELLNTTIEFGNLESTGRLIDFANQNNLQSYIADFRISHMQEKIPYRIALKASSAEFYAATYEIQSFCSLVAVLGAQEKIKNSKTDSNQVSKDVILKSIISSSKINEAVSSFPDSGFSIGKLFYKILEVYGIASPFAARTFLLAVFLSDGYAALKEFPSTPAITANQENAIGFFKTIIRLPAELQMLICNYLYNINKKFISGEDCRQAIPEAFKLLEPPTKQNSLQYNQ